MALRTTTRNRITNRDKWTFRWLQINDVNSYTNILELTVEFIRYGSYNQSDHATNHATKIIYTIPSNRILYSIAKQDDLISIRRSSLIQHHNHRRLWFDIVTIISPSINSTYYGTSAAGLYRDAMLNLSESIFEKDRSLPTFCFPNQKHNWTVKPVLQNLDV